VGSGKILADFKLRHYPKCREPTTPKRDVKGPRTILLVAAARTTLTAFSDESNNFNSFQRRNTRFPANFIADRAAEDWRRRGIPTFFGLFEGPLHPSSTVAADGRLRNPHKTWICGARRAKM
jgi:hypothetical protein